MSELELGIVVLCCLFGWVALLHVKITQLEARQDASSDHLRGVADQVNRLQREVRGK